MLVEFRLIRMVMLQVSLLGRLHHRNLVNLVGYCVDKGQRMLIYEFMSNGSLSNLLYSKFKVPVSIIRLEIVVTMYMLRVI